MDIIKSEDFDLRYTTLDDMPFLQRCLQSKGMLHWYPPEDEQELENFVRVWIGFCRYSASLTATFKKEPIGIATLFLMPYRKVAHQAMFQIIVDPKFQRQGVGGALMKNLKHLAKNYFRLELLSCEILDESSLIHLLKKLDFEVLYRQEKYMKEGDRYYPRVAMETVL